MEKAAAIMRSVCKRTRKKRKLIGIMTEKIKTEIEIEAKKMRQDKTSRNETSFINMKICTQTSHIGAGGSCGVQ